MSNKNNEKTHTLNNLKNVFLYTKNTNIKY